LAKYDLPVPGGPYNKNALQGRRLPEPTKPSTKQQKIQTSGLRLHHHRSSIA